MDEPIGIDDLDLPTLIGLTARLLNERTLVALHAHGFEDVRERDGYVVQHLVEGSIAVGVLAERLGVTQQAASKRVVELSARGLVTRSFAADDRRVTMVGLSPRGTKMVALARTVRADIEAQVEQVLGRDVRAARRALRAVLADLGGDALVVQRRIPEPEA